MPKRRAASPETATETRPRVRPELLKPQLVALDMLTPDPRNARQHDDANLDAIAKSLARFGQHRPLVAHARDGRLVVRIGNGTLEAMRRLGWSEAAVVVVEEDEADAVARAIADNRSAELATWDDGVLASLLREMPEDLLPASGFDSADLDALLASLEAREPGRAGLTDPDDVPDVPAEPVARPGDLWLLGDHRLLCGSSTSAQDVARLLDGARPELLVTDPPYGVSLDMEWRDRAGLNGCGPAEPSYMKERKAGHTNTAISGDTKADWSDAFELVPSIRVAYVWHASSFTCEVGLGLKRIGLQLRQMVVWRKPHFVLSRTHYHYQTEPCWYAVREGQTSAWVGTRDQSNLWDAASPKMLMNPGGTEDEKFDHPTQKPMLCMERPISNHDLPLVYEPFSGSGTTIIAAERRARRCFAMELDPKYVDVAVQRWERYTGRKAERRKA